MAGRPRKHPQVPCPNPLHAGSHVKANGSRRTKSGLRRDYLCSPAGERPHKFTLLVDGEEDGLPVYSPPPPCPVHGTASKRTRKGTYQSADGATHRQRYLCVPFETDPAYPRGYHTFTPKLPREHVHEGARCAACEQRRSAHSGGQAVSRRQSWPLRIVAEALERLANGSETYSSVSRWAWRATRRSRTRPAKLSDEEKQRRAQVQAWKRACLAAEAEGKRKPAKPRGLSLDPLPGARAQRRRRLDANGNTLPPQRQANPRSSDARRRWHVAADWVEMYAPVLWQPLHERLREEEHTEHHRRALMNEEERAADGRPQVLLLDDIPINTKAAFEGSLTPRASRDYFILCAATIHWPARVAGQQPPSADDRYTRLRLLRAYPSNESGAWRLLFQELGYEPGVREPEFILSDAGTGLRRGISDFFSTATFVPSLYHIHRALEQALERQTPGAVVIGDAGIALRPELTNHLGWLTGKRLRSITERQWSAWWNDFETLLERLGLPPEKIQERRRSYEEPVAQALPALRTSPGVPVSTGGFESVLRKVQPILTGRSHAFANIERTNNLLDLVVCRDHGVFDDQAAVIQALRAEALRYEGWSAEPRAVSDPQPPGADRYSSLRDRELLFQLVQKRGLAA